MLVMTGMRDVLVLTAVYTVVTGVKVVVTVSVLSGHDCTVEVDRSMLVLTSSFSDVA